LTGSGITLDALVRHASAAGWRQKCIVGTPIEDPHPQVADLAVEDIAPLAFGRPGLPFPVPGMSDVMPYPSTVFSTMTLEMLQTYRSAWEEHIRTVVSDFHPDVVHCHHLWIVASLLKDIVPMVPVVNHCHATALRQMDLCPELAPSVKQGCQRNELFAVLHGEHKSRLAACLDIDVDRVRRVGAGFRDDVFCVGQKASPQRTRVVFVGKYSAAKGLPWLLDAVERLQTRNPELRLDVVGGGSGEEAEDLARRIEGMAPRVVRHGLLSQSELASLFRKAHLCVLPSLYEGLPLVLVEALACGCRAVSTALPGVVEQLAPVFGDAVELIPVPPLTGPDSFAPRAAPAFISDIETALEKSLAREPLDASGIEKELDAFRWSTVFRRVEKLWFELLELTLD
jgi:glycosyltransferase involved in cell wall biosynthesis